MTIERLYVENGNRAGFWVQHRAWRNVCALVRRVSGRAEGALPPSRPTTRGARDGREADLDRYVIELQTFDLTSGRRVVLDAGRDVSADATFKRIASPGWARDLVGSVGPPAEQET